MSPAGAPRAERPHGPTGELAGALQVPRLLWHLPGLALRPRGTPGTIVVLPGRSTNDLSTVPLRTYLAARGHHVRGWGLGTNHGGIEALLPAATDVVEAAVVRAGGPVALVGQSLGGYLAREVARRAPDRVERVVTLGTPIFGALSSGSIQCPVTAVFSRADRVVGTGRAIDRDPATTNIEVSSTHFSMGIDPDVWRIVSDAVEGPR